MLSIGTALELLNLRPQSEKGSAMQNGPNRFWEIEQTEKYNESKWEYVLRSGKVASLCVHVCSVA